MSTCFTPYQNNNLLVKRRDPVVKQRPIHLDSLPFFVSLEVVVIKNETMRKKILKKKIIVRVFNIGGAKDIL